MIKVGLEAGRKGLGNMSTVRIEGGPGNM